MKTLVNKANPQIRITAEVETLYDKSRCVKYYYIKDLRLGLLQENWTLVEEEPKHTEVWVEGRTIFEQEGEPVGLEKATEEYIEKRASLTPNESWDIEDMRDAVRFGAKWMKEQTKKTIEL